MQEFGVRRIRKPKFKKSGRKLESGNKILLFMCDVTRINTEFRDTVIRQ